MIYMVSTFFRIRQDKIFFLHENFEKSENFRNFLTILTFLMVENALTFLTL